MLVFLLPVFLFFPAPSACLECPPGCRCSAATSTVECVSTDLHSVPLSLPGYARTLLITGNHIHQLGLHSFPQLENVTNVCLSNNR